MKKNCLVVILLTIAYVSANVRSHKDHPKYEKYRKFMQTYQKVYKDDSKEAEHFANYIKALDIIEKHNKNADQHGYKLGENHLTDWSQKDLLRIAGNGSLKKKNRVQPKDLFKAYLYYDTQVYFYTYNPSLVVPETLNLTTSVTPVKDQGYCGSCWAFAVVGALEAQLKKNAYNKFYSSDNILDLSEQQLLDCPDPDSFYVNGCEGGDPASAFAYINKYGIGLESAYKYTAYSGTCEYSKLSLKYKLTGYIQVVDDNPAALEQALNLYGPLSIAIDVVTTLSEFINYKNGTWDGSGEDGTMCAEDGSNHVMLLVGYTKDAWIIKNSWGKDWGQNGYLLLKKSATKNVCGILNYALVPQINLNDLNI